MGCAAAVASAAPYRPRHPEQTALHRIVRAHLETMLAQGCARTEHGGGYPAYVAHELRRYLTCGVLAYGFARLCCRSCKREHFVGFSCKGRICPSCSGRQMADTAAHLCDAVLPVAPYRQWTLSLPYALRYRLARSCALLSRVLTVYLRTLFAWQRLQARRHGVTASRCGAVTFVQRIGSLLQLGVFVRDGEALRFFALPAPTDADVAAAAPALSPSHQRTV